MTTVPSTLSLKIEEILRRYDQLRVDKEEASWKQFSTTVHGTWYKPFNREESLLKNDEINKQVEVVNKALLAVKNGRFDRGEMKTRVRRYDWAIWNFDSKEVITSSKDRHGIYVDLGLTLMFPGHAGIRLSGDPESIRGSSQNLPQFALALLKGYRVSPEAWEEIVALQPDIYESFCQQYEAILTEIEPKADAMCLKHRKKLEKSRARAARPDMVAKREMEARSRACKSLYNMLCSKKCKEILDRWNPEEFLTYLKFCQEYEYELTNLITWSHKFPLGSKVLKLEDVTTAIEMAKVCDVMNS
jgi:hypothetical protein